MRAALRNAGWDDRSTNGSLLLDRLMPPKSSKEESEAQRQFLKRVARAALPDDYRDACDSWLAGMKSIGAWTFEGELLSRLTVGLGVASPAENGLSLDRTWGVPSIPGSGIKGAVRAAAQEMLGLKDFDPAWKKDIVRDKLGADPSMLMDTFGHPEGMAAVTFFDARICWGSKPFVMETWTPHHQAYMTQGAPLPLETESPIPIALLAVPKGAKFRFAVLLPDDDWREALQPALNRALSRGLGAKQNQGYGRFRVSDWQIENRAVRDAGALGERGSAPTPGRSVTDFEAPAVPESLRNGPQTLPGVVVSRVRRSIQVKIGPHGQTTVNDAPEWAVPGVQVRVQLTVTQGRLQGVTHAKNIRPLA